MTNIIVPNEPYKMSIYITETWRCFLETTTLNGSSSSSTNSDLID